jgi:D-alanyl-D-alanine dipeptidase
MRFALIGLVLLGMVTTAAAQSPAAVAQSIRSRTQKLIVVTTPDWDAVQGVLARYERQNGKWQQIGDAIPVVVGRSGLAWDPLLARGYSGVYPGPIKHEGDGRSPAGLFQVKNAFGFEPLLAGSDTYLPLTSSTECVDDTSSRHYAQIVDRQKVDVVDWKSSEKMREIPGYRWGAVVNYNMERTIKGDGSCIFLHQWSGPSSGTAGCTAMAAGDIEALVRWLRGEQDATLVQLPKLVYEVSRKRWSLP